MLQSLTTSPFVDHKLMSLTGFLIKKTIQEYPVRGELNYYGDYEKQNLILYINKKLADLKLTSSGSELNAKRIVNMKIKDAEDKASKRPFSRTLRRLLEAPPEKSAVSPQSRKSRAPPVEPEKKVASLLNEQLLRNNLTTSLFQEYKLANLKANLQKMLSQKDEKDLQLSELNYVELEDDEQILYFLDQLQRAHPEIDVAKMLNVQVERRPNQARREDALSELIEKRINKEELDKILSRDHRNEQQNIVKVYKETRYDQFEPEYKKKNKLKMATFKKRMEIQEKLFAELLNDDGRQRKDEPAQNLFLRTPMKGKVLAVPKSASQKTSQRTSQRNSMHMLTKASQHTYHTSNRKSPLKRSDSEIGSKLNDLLDQCESVEKTNKKEKRQFKRKLRLMNKEMVNSMRAFSVSQNESNLQAQHHAEFVKFQFETQFKKKLINYLLDQVPSAGDVISQKSRADNTRKFMKNISQEYCL